MKKLIAAGIGVLAIFSALLGITLFRHDYAPATCVSAATCTICGKTKGKPLGHDEVQDAGYAPVCKRSGLSDGVHCSRCGEILVPQKKIPPLGHTPVTDSAVAPSCAVSGLTEGTHCSVCGEILTAQEPVPALGHNWVDATCTTPCLCRTCGESVGNPLGHTWEDASCTEPMTCLVCGVVAGNALGHTPAPDAAVAPTCTETGLTEGTHCSVCGTILTVQEIIPALGHTLTEATCNAPVHCTRCGEEFGSPLEHQWQDATCTQKEICALCGAERGESVGHQWMMPTCTEGKKCAVCGEISGEPLGHIWKEATVRSPKTCTVCGLTEGKPLADTQNLPVLRKGGVSFLTPTDWTVSDEDDSSLSFTPGQLPEIVSFQTLGKAYSEKQILSNIASVAGVERESLTGIRTDSVDGMPMVMASAFNGDIYVTQAYITDEDASYVFTKASYTPVTAMDGKGFETAIASLEKDRSEHSDADNVMDGMLLSGGWHAYVTSVNYSAADALNGFDTLSVNIPAYFHISIAADEPGETPLTMDYILYYPGGTVSRGSFSGLEDGGTCRIRTFADNSLTVPGMLRLELYDSSTGLMIGEREIERTEPRESRNLSADLVLNSTLGGNFRVDAIPSGQPVCHHVKIIGRTEEAFAAVIVKFVNGEYRSVSYENDLSSGSEFRYYSMMDVQEGDVIRCEIYSAATGELLGTDEIGISAQLSDSTCFDEAWKLEILLNNSRYNDYGSNQITLGDKLVCHYKVLSGPEGYSLRCVFTLHYPDGTSETMEDENFRAIGSDNYFIALRSYDGSRGTGTIRIDVADASTGAPLGSATLQVA